jgi:putative FmdB family regulatory protein
MPKYVYHCEACDELFEIYHSMKEKYNTCDLCGENDFIYRVPQMTKIVRKDQTGKKVKDSIEENRKILEELKKEGKEDYG